MSWLGVPALNKYSNHNSNYNKEYYDLYNPIISDYRDHITSITKQQPPPQKMSDLYNPIINNYKDLTSTLSTPQINNISEVEKIAKAVNVKETKQISESHTIKLTSQQIINLVLFIMILVVFGMQISILTVMISYLHACDSQKPV